MSEGRYLDPDFTEYFSKFRVPEFFNSRDAEYITTGPSTQENMSVSNQAVDTAKVNRGALINTAIAQASQ